VPPVPGISKGSAEFKLNLATKTLTWIVHYDRLSSPATAAHIHGPAKRGITADIEFDLAPNGMKKLLTGSAVLTDAQINDLGTDRTYINIDTTKYANGEIRGQIIPQM
jgi:hypothetical protein